MFAYPANPITADFNIQITGNHNVSFIYNGDVSTITSARARMANVKKFSAPMKEINNNLDVITTLKSKILKQ